jgi:hypothetical protein
MKLTFRGHAYEVPAPIQLVSASTDQPQMKLIDRGQTYDYTSRAAVVSEVVEPGAPTVTLIYRGNVYERHLQPPKAYQKPDAINWRWKPA